MKLLTFTGETPAEALKKVQAECGDEAMVLDTKEIKKKTLTTPGLYEITVAYEKKDEPERAKNQESTPPKEDNDVLLTLSETIQQINNIANVTTHTQKSNIVSEKDEQLKKPQEQKQKDTKKTIIKSEMTHLKDIQQEISKVSDKVKLIQNMIWDQDKNKRATTVSIPPEFAEIYRIAKESGMLKEHLDEIMRLSLENMPLAMRQNSKTVRRYFNVLLRKLTPIRIENKLSKPNKKIMMLVGPTGVGKTTTIAKLAARFAYKKEIKYKVGIITVDTYRIGAVEQLMHYAKIMKLGIESVEDPIDFSRAIASLKHCDYILIDTAGSSQHDHEKIDKIKQFLDYEPNISIDVSLVLSANTKYDDLREIYKNFSVLGIDTIIATKFDESRGFGNVFSLVYENKKPLSYFSTGQEVPDDLLAASAEFFTECLLDGFKRIDNE